MKKSLFLLSFIWLSMIAFSQAPLGINYQTVIRDSEGQTIANTGLTLKMTIRFGVPDGNAVYVETHTVVSNAFGLVNLVIGQGTPQFTDFSAIRWGNAAHYLETAIDLAGNGQFTILGVTQFVSVPYSLYSGQSGGILNMNDQERAAIQNPPAGMQIFNLSTRCLNYYDGYDWFQTCGSLIVNQHPETPFNITPADGAINLPLEVNLNWGCIDPELDPLVYDVYFGLNYPPTLMESSLGTTSFLVSQLEHSTQYYWKVVAHDGYGNTTEGQVWSFFTAFCNPPPVFAGQDATICSNGSYYIQEANTGGAYNFVWTTSGDGTFSSTSSLTPIYTPGILEILNGLAELTLTAYANDPCPPITGSDMMMLTIAPDPMVYAGPDQTVCVGEVVQLSAIATNYNQVQWIAVDGSDDFSNQYSLTTEYYPNINEWNRGYSEIGVFVSPIEPCFNNAFDYIFIYYESLPACNAGTDQLNIAGTTASLEGNTPPVGGYGVWSIQSGTGGSFTQPNNPTSQFTGIAGNTYTLLWTLYSFDNCNSTDDVQISFFGCAPQVTADAGPDQTVCSGVEVQMDGTASNYSYINWATYDGLGGFPDNGIEDAVYWPSPIDQLNGCIHLTMDALPIAPCTVYATDTMQLCFYATPTANAGPDQSNHAGTSTTLAGNTPPNGGYGVWSISTGTGGSIAQPNNPTSAFTGVAGNSYYLIWKVYDQHGCMAEDGVSISFASNWACGQSFTDTRDGKSYTTVQIGTQCWMQQNLDVGTMIVGSTIQTNNGSIEKYCYNNSQNNCNTYGGLYQWDEMMQYTTTAGVKGICPTGWHLPTDAEWCTITTYLDATVNCAAIGWNGTNAGGKMKETGTTHWISPNTGATNSSGFTGLPGGYFEIDFGVLGSYGIFWSSTEYSATAAWKRYLPYNAATVNRSNSIKADGMSVRCVRD
jgi:uncharacterized protein (TIGR02145 family)